MRESTWTGQTKLDVFRVVKGVWRGSSRRSTPTHPRDTQQKFDRISLRRLRPRCKKEQKCQKGSGRGRDWIKGVWASWRSSKQGCGGKSDTLVMSVMSTLKTSQDMEKRIINNLECLGPWITKVRGDSGVWRRTCCCLFPRISVQQMRMTASVMIKTRSEAWTLAEGWPKLTQQWGRREARSSKSLVTNQSAWAATKGAQFILCRHIRERHRRGPCGGLLLL